MNGEKNLKLNDGKAETIVIQGNSRQTRDNDLGILDVGGAQLMPVESVRDLVFFSFSFSFFFLILAVLI